MSSPFEQISGLLTKKSTALVERSSNTLDSIIGDGFIYINSEGKRSTKSEYIALCTTGALAFREQQIENLKIQEFGDFALATMILNDDFDFLGERHQGKFRSMCAFRRLENRWVWVGGQTCEL